MNGYELKTGLYSPDEVPKEHAKVGLSTHYNQIDEIILDTIAQRMNFTARQVPPTDNQSFGYQLPNGTYVGAIGTNEMISLWNYSRLV